MSDTVRPLNGPALESHLKKHGVIPTPQRLEIAEVLFRRAQHMSADQIMAAVNRGDSPKVSKATVYNTLKLFSDKGLVREVIVDPARVFYDSTTGSHHHIYNVDSGELQDIPSQEVTFSKLPQLPEGMQPDGIEVIMRVRKRRD
ncbi:MAG TPA: Fur family transcriptional regulator [Gammaproteobacteria bacterium]|nr:Fur family transcriptional regulator [Gammaproteobacteria bacterium]